MKPLVDLMPANARKYVYAVLSAAVFVYGVWEASQGDWTQFVVATVTSLVALMATANTGEVTTPREELDLAYRLGQMDALNSGFEDTEDFDTNVN